MSSRVQKIFVRFLQKLATLDVDWTATGGTGPEEEVIAEVLLHAVKKIAEMKTGDSEDPYGELNDGYEYIDEVCKKLREDYLWEDLDYQGRLPRSSIEKIKNRFRKLRSHPPKSGVESPEYELEYLKIEEDLLLEEMDALREEAQDIADEWEQLREEQRDVMDDLNWTRNQLTSAQMKLALMEKPSRTRQDGKSKEQPSEQVPSLASFGMELYEPAAALPESRMGTSEKDSMRSLPKASSSAPEYQAPSTSCHGPAMRPSFKPSPYQFSAAKSRYASQTMPQKPYLDPYGYGSSLREPSEFAKSSVPLASTDSKPKSVVEDRPRAADETGQPELPKEEPQQESSRQEELKFAKRPSVASTTTLPSLHVPRAFPRSADLFGDDLSYPETAIPPPRDSYGGYPFSSGRPQHPPFGTTWQSQASQPPQPLDPRCGMFAPPPSAYLQQPYQRAPFGVGSSAQYPTYPGPNPPLAGSSYVPAFGANGPHAPQWYPQDFWRPIYPRKSANMFY